MPSTPANGFTSSRREASEIIAALIATATGAIPHANAMEGTDIDPQSGFRLPLPRRADLDEPAQRIYDEIADPKGVTLRGLHGPGGIYLHSPRLAVLLRPLNDYLRNQSGLTGRTRETAILSVARICDSQFEWAAHEREAAKEGVPPAVIDAIKHRKPTSGLDAADAVVIDLCRESFISRKVTPALYARALKQFGRQQLIDLVVLMGYYSMTAVMLTAFDMQLDPGQSPPLPMP